MWRRNWRKADPACLDSCDRCDLGLIGIVEVQAGVPLGGPPAFAGAIKLFLFTAQQRRSTIRLDTGGTIVSQQGVNYSFEPTAAIAPRAFAGCTQLRTFHKTGKTMTWRRTYAQANAFDKCGQLDTPKSVANNCSWCSKAMETQWHAKLCRVPAETIETWTIFCLAAKIADKTASENGSGHNFVCTG